MQHLKTFENKSHFVLALGGGTPCFENNMAFIQKHFLSIYLQVDAMILLKRIQKNREKRPLLNQLSQKEQAQKIQELLEKREEKYYKKADWIIKNENIQKTLKEILKKINDLSYKLE